LGEMDAKLLQKIEELTLYTIQQQKQIEVLLEQNKKQQEEIDQLKKQ
ncbi:cell wall anchor protein, partial [Sinomicrobium pectinilyticum]